MTVRLIAAGLVLSAPAPPPPKPNVPWTLLTQCNVDSTNLPRREHIV